MYSLLANMIGSGFYSRAHGRVQQACLVLQTLKGESAQKAGCVKGRLWVYCTYAKSSMRQTFGGESIAASGGWVGSRSLDNKCLLFRVQPCPLRSLPWKSTTPARRNKEG